MSADSNARTVSKRKKEGKCRLLDLPEDLILQAIAPGDETPSKCWTAPVATILPTVPEAKNTMVADCPLFQTCRQLRDLVLKHHTRLVVNVPAVPDIPQRISTKKRYLKQFELGCKALKRTLETAAEHATSNIVLTLQTLDDRLPRNKSWQRMYSKLCSAGVQVAQLRTLKLKGLQLSETIFAELVHNAPSLQNLALHGIQFREIHRATPYAQMQAGKALSLQHLEMVGCCFPGTSTFAVRTESVVALPNLFDFVYIDEMHSKRDPTRCPWQWLFLVAKPQQITSLTVHYGYIHELSRDDLQHLSKFRNLKRINLGVKMRSAVMSILLNMPNLSHAKLRMDYAFLKRDISMRVWAIKELLITQRHIDRNWVEAMSRMPLDGPGIVEVAHGYYSISLSDYEVPLFLALAQRITWSGSCGQFSTIDNSPKRAILLLPYVEYLCIHSLDLSSELAKALAVETRHRTVTLHCRRGAPVLAAADLPVLFATENTLVLGPSIKSPKGEILTWDLQTVWELLVEYRTQRLKLHHWRSTALQCIYHEQGVRRRDITRKLLETVVQCDHYKPDDPLSSLLKVLVQQ